MHPVAVAGRLAVADAQCKVHALEPLRVNEGSGKRLIELTQRERNWPESQYSGDFWMQQYLTSDHPWVVPDSAGAEVILLLTNISIACIQGKMRSSFATWLDIRLQHSSPGADLNVTVMAHRPKQLAEPLLGKGDVWPAWPAAANRPQVAITMHCSGWTPWGKDRGSAAADSMIRLTWIKMSELDVTMPPVTSVDIMGWAAAGTLASLLPYHERPLLFFGGRICKPYISAFRLQVWGKLVLEQQLGNRTRERSIVVQTSYFPRDLIERYSICTSEAAIKANWSTYCMRGSSTSAKCATSEAHLRKKCAGWPRLVEWDAMRTATPAALGLGGKLSRESFMKTLAGNRFCAVAPGDNVGTGKIGESIVVAAVGGCIPVFIMPDGPIRMWGTQPVFHSVSVGETTQTSNRTREERAARSKSEYPVLTARWAALPNRTRHHVSFSQWWWMHRSMAYALPYLRWLDYCEISLVVPATHAVKNMAAVLDALEAVPEDRLQRMAQAARAAQPAFLYASRYRGGDNLAAQDYILAELCHRARHLKKYGIATRQLGDLSPNPSQHLAHGPEESPLALATRLERCLVLPP